MKLFALNLIGAVALSVSPGIATSDIVPADFSIADIQASIRAACPVEAEQAARTPVVVSEYQPIADTVVLDMTGMVEFEGGIGYSDFAGGITPAYMDSEVERDISIAHTGLTYNMAAAVGSSIRLYGALDKKEALPRGVVAQTRAFIDIVKCLSKSEVIDPVHWTSIKDGDCYLEMFDGWTRILEKDELHLSMENASFDWDAARNAFIAHMDYIAAKYPACTIDRS